ncbi:hypothetical protein HD554DRAFT_2039907 [Boletus coccyginus]|nr:hypothetical protein HD554DRAFT_2039907 [Boletus coccyginus]
MSLLAKPYTPLPMDHVFDDYLQEYTLEDLQLAILENVKGGMCSNWYFFKDYNYKLLPDFMIVFNQQDPIHVSDHLFPIGESEFWDPSCQDETMVYHLSTDCMDKLQ